MSHIVELSIDKIFETAITESGQAFRGIRSMANNAEEAALIDSSADNFLLTEDDKASAMPHLNIFVSELYDTIRGYCPEYVVEEDTLAFAIEGAEDCNTTARVTPLVKMFFVYRILAWWFRYRNGDMANNYLLLADDYRQQVLSAIVPKFSTRKLRMF
jgi:hypothetical protein